VGCARRNSAGSTPGAPPIDRGQERQKRILDDGVVLARDVERPRYTVTLCPPGGADAARFKSAPADRRSRRRSR
jgi:hypothetical protein